MTLTTNLDTGGVPLSAMERKRIQRYLAALDRRLSRHPAPTATLVLAAHEAQRRVTADLRVRLTPLGEHLVSHQAAPTAAHAVRLAIEDVERQLERQLASQRGEPTYGVPSRRLPEALRPHPPTASQPRGGEEAGDEGEETTP